MVGLGVQTRSGRLPATWRSGRQAEAKSIPYPRYARQGQSDVLDCERLCDAEDERAREMCTGRLMFVAAEDNVVLVEPRQKPKLATACGITFWPGVES